ncbi:MAG: GxxExxY protein [Polyangiaceae bacterium]
MRRARNSSSRWADCRVVPADFKRFFGPKLRLELVEKLVHDAAFTIHRALGPGFPELVYREALLVELGRRALGFREQVPLPVDYRGRRIAHSSLELVVDERLLVELSTREAFARERARALACQLRAVGLPLGLLITFNGAEPCPQVLRVAPGAVAA